MCRRYPGPRCSKATLGYYNRAKSYLADAIARGADESIIRRYEASVAANAVKVHNTPAYEKSLREAAVEAATHAPLVRNAITRSGYLAKAQRLDDLADMVRRDRLDSRASVRNETLASWTTTKLVPDVDGRMVEKVSEHEMSYAQAASLYNAALLDTSVTRGVDGNMAPAKAVRAIELDEHQQAALDRFTQEGFKVRPRVSADFANTYHVGMEPDFRSASKGRIPQTVRVGGEAVPAVLVQGSKPRTTTIRVHDDNGLTHEAKVTVATLKGADGKYHTVARMVGSSALFGNRAAQDGMESHARGALLKTDAPHWTRTMVLSSGTQKRAQLAAENKELAKLTVSDTYRPNGHLAHVVANLGTQSINRRVRRGEPISQTTLDLDMNYAQTSSRGK